MISRCRLDQNDLAALAKCYKTPPKAITTAIAAGHVREIDMDHSKRLETAFVIVAQPRSGSTLLAHAFDAHDSIICHDEIFSENWVNGYRTADEDARSYEKLASKLLAERNEDPEKFLLDRVFLENGKVNGFKIVYSDLMSGTPAAKFLRCFINQTRIKVIHLRRSNMLRCYVSVERMRELGVVHSNNSKPSSKKLTIDLAKFTNFMISQDNNSDFVCRMMNVVAQPRYEQLMQGYNVCLDALGVRRRPFVQQLSKVASHSLSATVANSEEFLKYDFPRTGGFVTYTD